MNKSTIVGVALAALVVACGGGREIDLVSTAAGEPVSVNRPSAVEHVPTRSDVHIEKQLLYDQHTLADTFPYKDGTRAFQFGKIRDRLFALDSVQRAADRVASRSVGNLPARWAVLQNRRNIHGQAPTTKRFSTNEYHSLVDLHGVERRQSVPLYAVGEFGSQAPERYGRDGSPVRLLGYNADSTAFRLESYNAPGEWEVPLKYVKPIATTRFDKVVMVDLTNQIVATLERAPQSAANSNEPGVEQWLVRSMNPCTTGKHQPPHSFPTPEGVFVVQDRTPRMLYDNGGPAIVGFAPWASRFTNGAFLHGWPVNDPGGAIVEFSPTLGTVPRSHECVRNASSHAKFIYDWAPLEKTLVFIYD